MSQLVEFLLDPLVLVQVGSFLVLISYMTKDFMRLRLSLIFANLFFLLPVIFYEKTFLPQGFWSVLFILVNAERIWVMYRDSQPIKLTSEQQVIYEALFKHLKPKHFLRLYKKGQMRSAESDQFIVKKGEAVDRLRVLVSGEATVFASTGTHFLSSGQLMGEMGFLTGKPASADVMARGRVTFLEWNRKVLDREFIRKEYLEAAVSAAIGIDLTKKLQSPNLRPEGPSAEKTSQAGSVANYQAEPV